MTKPVLLLAAVAALMPAVHAQNCAGLSFPVKPAMVCAGTPRALCLCSPSGQGCHYEWVCPPQASTPQNQTDWSIPLQYKPPQVQNQTQNQLQVLIQLQQLRNLQLQQQQLQLQQGQAHEESPTARGSELNLRVEPPTEAERNGAETAMTKVASDKPYLTRGLPNGLMWKVLSEDQKTAFVLGYLAGVGVSGPLNRDDLMPSTLTAIETVRAVDAFYVDAQNERLPAGFAIPIIARRTAGKDKDSIEADLKHMRDWVDGK